MVNIILLLAVTYFVCITFVAIFEHIVDLINRKK